MLTTLGFLTVAAVLVLLLSNRVAAVVALIGVPVVAAFVAGFSPAKVGEFITGGIGDVAGVAAMFVFAILFFGVLRDAGMFDPVVRRVVRFAGRDPVTVALATAILAAVTHLDGAGAVTFLITIPALLPVYDALKMSRLVLTTIVGLSAGVMNIVPWGGPTARAAATVKVEANRLWVPLIPAQVVGLVAVLAIAYLLGRRERARLAEAARAPGADDGPAGTRGPAGATGSPDAAASADAAGRTGVATDHGAPAAPAPARTGGPSAGPSAGATTTGTTATTVAAEAAQGTAPATMGVSAPTGDPDLARPRMFWVNVALALATVAALIWGQAPPEAVFMVALILALVVNYPGLKSQTARINAHAQGAVLMASTLLAAGAFLGIMGKSGMTGHMAHALTGVVPSSLGGALPITTGALGVPASLLFGPDTYYFGVLPVLTSLGAHLGVAPVHLARASILGEETAGFPISPLTGSFYLLVGLAGVDIGSHIRRLLPWAWLVNLIMLAVAVLTGVIPV